MRKRHFVTTLLTAAVALLVCATLVALTLKARQPTDTSAFVMYTQDYEDRNMTRHPMARILATEWKVTP